MQLAPSACPQCSHANRPTAQYCGICGSQLAVATTNAAQSSPRLASGAVVGGGRYRVEQRLGRGGFGEVYLAFDTVLRRECVLKRPHLDEALTPPLRAEILESFEREALLLASLNTPGHPNIPEIYEYLAADRVLVMKYIAGESLGRHLNRRITPIPEEVALRYVREVCAALVYMHSRRPLPVLHRDVKPDNILLGADGRVWLVDFGLAKGLAALALGARARQSGAAGTLGYAPLEQWRAKTEPRSDVYALAVTLYVLLTNHAPTAEDAYAHMRGERDLLPPIARLYPQARPALASLLERGLARDPEDRPTADEFLATLEALLAQPEIPPPPAPPRPPTVALIGRASELDAYAARLATQGVALITGMPGVGKTALAAALSARVDAGSRTFWHRFRAGDGPNLLMWELAVLLAWNGQSDLWQLLQGAGRNGALPIPPQVVLDYALQLLRGQNYLLVLDDLHVVEGEAQMAQCVERLAAEASAGALRLIITSRTRPAFIDQPTPTLRGLAPAEATALLRQQGSALADELLARLCFYTEGNAQLLTLAAEAFAHTPDPDRVMASLLEHGRLADYLLHEVDRGLTPEERAVMQAVAALLGYGGTRGAVEALLDGESAWRPLRALAQRNLLVTEEGQGDPIYGQHALVQSFYYEMLSRREREELHRRAAAHFGPLDVLQAARHHLRAGAPDRAADLATANAWQLVNRGAASALRALLEELLATTLGTAQAIAARITLGEICALLGEGATARAAFEGALGTLATQAAETQGAQYARICRGMAAALEYEAPQEAVAWARRGLEAPGERAPHEEGLLRHREGGALIAAGAYEAAQATLERALALLAEPVPRADVLVNLGVVACSLGQLGQGEAHFRDALAIYETAGQTWRIVGLRHNLARIKDLVGDWPGAAAAYRETIALAGRMGSSVDMVATELLLGILMMKQGDHAGAQAQLTAVVERAAALGLQEYRVAGLASLGDLWLRLGKQEQAAEAIGAARAGAEAMAARDQLVEIGRLEAELALQRGDAAWALERADATRAMARDLSLEAEEGAALRVRARALWALGRAAEAREALAESARLVAGDSFEAAQTLMVSEELEAGGGLPASDP